MVAFCWDNTAASGVGKLKTVKDKTIRFKLTIGGNEPHEQEPAAALPPFTGQQLDSAVAAAAAAAALGPSQSSPRDVPAGARQMAAAAAAAGSSPPPADKDAAMFGSFAGIDRSDSSLSPDGRAEGMRGRRRSSATRLRRISSTDSADLDGPGGGALSRVRRTVSRRRNSLTGGQDPAALVVRQPRLRLNPSCGGVCGPC